MTRVQALGPRQEAWLTALESGDYEQTAVVLCHEESYCCLGVACELMGDLLERAHLHYNGELSLLPREARDYYGFRDHLGSASDGESCADMNDAGLLFAEIAATIRADPGNYFEESL